MTFSENLSGKIKYQKFLLNGGRILLILSPVLLLLLESLIEGQNLFLGVPAWSDELDYWRECFSFSENGFHFGGSMYVGMDAVVGPLGAHSFSPLAAWGAFLWLFRTGAGAHAIVWVNLILLMAAWALFTVLVKPDLKLTAEALLMAFLYPETILYLHSSMIEMAVMAGLILYFSLLVRWNREEKKVWFILLMLAGVWCVCMRVTYIVILFPAIWKKNAFRLNLKTFLSLAAYVVCFGIFYKLYNLFCSDYPGWTTSKLTKAEGMQGKLSLILTNAKENLVRFFSPRSADLSQVGMRYFYFLLILLLVVLAITAAREKTDPFRDRIWLALAISLGGLWLMMVFLYDIKDWRDYRTFAPLAFGTFLFLLCEQRKKFTKICLWLLGCFVVMTFTVSGVDFIRDKGETECLDLSDAFSALETEDEEGRPLTVGTDQDLNWCDISVMQSLPSELGLQIFYEDITEENIGDVDYVFVTEETVSKDPDLFEQLETVAEVEDYGTIYRVR